MKLTPRQSEVFTRLLATAEAEWKTAVSETNYHEALMRQSDSIAADKLQAVEVLKEALRNE